MKENSFLNLNLYYTFYFVAKSGSFKEAAQKLYISQPAISKQIKELENSLNIKLFNRHSKGIELTEVGKNLLEQLEHANFYLNSAINYINLSKQLKVGEITIGCPSHIASFYLLDYVKQFKKIYKNIEVKVISSSTSELIELLNHHKLDFIIDLDPININYSDVTIKLLKEYETTFIVNSSYDVEIKKFKDLNNKKFVLPLPRSSVRKQLEKLFFEQNIPIEVGLAVDTTDLIIQAVKLNLGIGYVIKDAVKNELEQGILKEIKTEVELPKLNLNLIYKKEFLTKLSEEFIKLFM